VSLATHCIFLSRLIVCFVTLWACQCAQLTLCPLPAFALRVEFLLKTNSGYPRDAEVTFFLSFRVFLSFFPFPVKLCSVCHSVRQRVAACLQCVSSVGVIDVTCVLMSLACHSDSPERSALINTSKEMGQARDTSTQVTFNALNSTSSPQILDSLLCSSMDAREGKRIFKCSVRIKTSKLNFLVRDKISFVGAQAMVTPVAHGGRCS